MTLSGQLQILRTGSNLKQGEDVVDKQFPQKGLRNVECSYMRDPGQSWSLGWPLAHLKYFLQLSGFGKSSPSLEQEVLQAVDKDVKQCQLI